MLENNTCVDKNKAKISRFAPESAKSSLALYVHGTHAFFVGDPKTKETLPKWMSAGPM